VLILLIKFVAYTKISLLIVVSEVVKWDTIQ